MLHEFPQLKCLLGGHDHVPWNSRSADSQRIAVKAGLDCENVDVLEYEISEKVVSKSSGGSTALGQKSFNLKLVSHKLVPLVDKGKGGFAADGFLEERIAGHKKILSLNDFALFEWPSLNHKLEAWAAKVGDASQSSCWTTKDIRTRQVNFFHLVAEWIRAELGNADALDDTVMIANSGQFRANVDYNFSDKLTFNEMNKELAFNNKMMKVKLLGSDILALITESELRRKGQ
ncbi:unnamed protein product, partial [Amoebophrya sp. A25]|eukprot:GSA25T00012156001.1